MTTNSDRLPFFVYGTLRPGCGNDVCWTRFAHATHDGRAIVWMHRLVTRGWFPYLVPVAERIHTCGALIVPDDDAYEAIQLRFDQLEGVPYHYDRHAITVLTPDGLVPAWTYMPIEGVLHGDEYVVGTNDEGVVDWMTWREDSHAVGIR